MSEEKIAAEKAKYAYREEVGFLFTGMKVFLKKKLLLIQVYQSDHYVTLPRNYGRTLEPEDIYRNGMFGQYS